MIGQNLALLAPDYSSAADLAGCQRREIAGRHSDGHELALEVSFGEFVQGARKLATGVLRDISRRKRAEEELRHTNETLRALIEATPLAIVAVDSEENVSKWNSAAEKMFGWSEAEVLGKPLPFTAPVAQAACRGVSFTQESVRQTKSG